MNKVFAIQKNETQVEPTDTLTIPIHEVKVQLAHGKKYFKDKDYLRAIEVLSPIYTHLKIEFLKHPICFPEDLFFETCYYLGRCYVEIKQYGIAYNYLDMIKDVPNTKYRVAYINYFVETFDICVLTILKNEEYQTRQELELLEIDPKDHSDVVEKRRKELWDYYAYIQRKMGYVQIKLNELEKATETFTLLQQHEGTRKYAAKMLAHITQLTSKSYETII